jgi:hypothetical protein
MKILDWLNERKEFCIGSAEQAPHTVESKHLISEAKKYEHAARIIRAAEQALSSRDGCQTRNVVGFPQIDQLERLIKEIK